MTKIRRVLITVMLLAGGLSALAQSVTDFKVSDWAR